MISSGNYQNDFPKNAPPTFNSKFHQGRREALAKMMPENSAIIIAGGTYQMRNGDTEHPYRPGNNVFYFSGFEEADSLCIMEKKPLDKNRFTLVVPEKDPEKEIWTGRRAGVSGAKRDFCADHAEDTSQLESLLKRICESTKKIFLVLSDTNSDLNEKLSSMVQGSSDWTSVITQMRLVKTKEELDLIRHAIEITAEGYKSMMRPWPKGTNEGELQAVHEYELRRRGSVRVAFPTIVASGNNATTLHYERNSSKINPNDLVLVDSGAEYGNYSADVTRTWPISGKFSQVQRALYEIVYNAQEAVMKIVKPGVCLNEIQDVSERVIENGLRSLGILSKNSKREEVKRYYPHSLGHHMGLDVHDGYDGSIEKAALKQQGLRPNMVITNEPGIYIPENDESVDEKWRGIGIRIEDDILVTEDGCTNLTEMIPRHPDEIEGLF